VGWFGRDEKTPAPPPRPDEALPFFSEDEAARFRSLVRSTFAELGMEVVVHADHMQADDGRTFGLWNLAAACHNDEDGEPGWPAAIERHVRITSAATARDELAEMSEEELMSSVYVRLVESASLGQLGRDDVEYASEVAPGVLRLLVVDLPETVVTPAQSRLEERAPLPRLLDQGWRNLHGLLDREVFELDTLEHEGAAFSILLGESMMTATLVLMLPEVIERWAPGSRLDRGAFVCLPYRHQLAFHVIDDPEQALKTLMVMPQFAVRGFSDGTGPLSPHTYWWRDGELHQLTTFEDDGRIALTVPPELEALLGLDAD
jgi:hypothetical protein